MAKSKKLKPQLDEFDLAAEREGQAVKKASETRVKRASKKPKVGIVDSRTLDKSFVDRYGNSGYIAKKEDQDG